MLDKHGRVSLPWERLACSSWTTSSARIEGSMSLVSLGKEERGEPTKA